MAGQPSKFNTQAVKSRNIGTTKMKPITDATQVSYYGTLVRDMMLTEVGRECEFNPDWVRRHDWKIVPVESAMRLPDEDIPLLVSALKAAGYTECLAVF